MISLRCGGDESLFARGRLEFVDAFISDPTEFAGYIVAMLARSD